MYLLTQQLIQRQSTGLPFGSYYVVIDELDSPFCSFTTAVQGIGTPNELILAVTPSASVTCSNDQGAIAPVIQGGTGTYTLLVVNTTTGRNYGSQTTGLESGSYSVTVTDGNGCTDTETVNLAPVTPISITRLDRVNPVCNGDATGSVTVVGVSGGENIPANYTYVLNFGNGNQSSASQGIATFTGLPAGDYSVTINDGYGNCQITVPFTLTENPKIEATLRQVTNSQNCNTSAQSLELEITSPGSGAPYTYDTSATGAFANSFAGTSVIIPNLLPGDYSYYVKDSAGCISVVTGQIKIDQVEPLQLNILPQSNTFIDCFGGTTGAIYVEAKGGQGNYQYNLVHNSGIPNLTNGNGIFTGLPAGDYTVSVASSDGSGNASLACNPVSRFVTIGEPFAHLLQFQLQLRLNALIVAMV